MKEIQLTAKTGKEEFPMAALDQAGLVNEIITVGGHRARLIREITVKEAYEQSGAFYTEIVRSVPPGMKVFWYQCEYLDN